MSDDNAAIERIEERIADGWVRGTAVGEGWYTIIIELNEKLSDLYPDYEIHQVKEKFGGLRYYCSVDGNEDARALITEAQEQAARTCELCGKPGELRGRGWLRTLCDECEANG